MKQLPSCHVTSQKGFSLIEVVLAIGIFLVTVLALGWPTRADTSVGRRSGEDRRSVIDREYDQCVSAEFARNRTWSV